MFKQLSIYILLVSLIILPVQAQTTSSASTGIGSSIANLLNLTSTLQQYGGINHQSQRRHREYQCDAKQSFRRRGQLPDLDGRSDATSG